jgi:hypothetical protein
MSSPRDLDELQDLASETLASTKMRRSRAERCRADRDPDQKEQQPGARASARQPPDALRTRSCPRESGLALGSSLSVIPFRAPRHTLSQENRRFSRTFSRTASISARTSRPRLSSDDEVRVTSRRAWCSRRTLELRTIDEASRGISRVLEDAARALTPPLGLLSNRMCRSSLVDRERIVGRESRPRNDEVRSGREARYRSRSFSLRTTLPLSPFSEDTASTRGPGGPIEN